MTVDGTRIGRRIRARRSERALSLNALAERSGVSKGYLSQLETGTASNPSVDTLRKVADALELSLEELVSDPQRPESTATALPAGLAEFIAERESLGKPVPEEDVEMLRGISYRGRRPQEAEDWAFLYETIARTLK